MNNFYFAQKLAFFFEQKNLKLAVAESCTAGGLAYQLTAVSGSSKWFDRGFITYNAKAKVELLGVNFSTLEQYGEVSESTAIEMAIGTLQRSQADIGLSITGIAGPFGGTLEKPVGTVWFAMVDRHEKRQSSHKIFTGGREQIRHDAIGFALLWIFAEYA